MRVIIKRSVKWFANALKLLSIELGVILLTFAASMGVAIFMIKEVFFGPGFTYDQQMITWVRGIISPGLTSFYSFITFFGSHRFLVPANLVLMAYAFFIIRNKWLGIKITAVSLSSLLLMVFLKKLFNRPRPEEPLLERVSGLSFPSGHALMSFAFYGLLAYLAYKQIKNPVLRYITVSLLIIVICIIAFSRVYLNVHYTSDVLAGIALGIIWLVISLGILHFMEKRKSALPNVNAA